jgi:4-hydroxy-tetrahydrodipicolinate synthase
VAFQVEHGVHGLWANGTSSEFAAFGTDERARAVETVVDAAGGRPVIANVSDAGTKRVIEHAQRSVAAGADAVAATPPFYFPHSQDEVLEHFRAIRAAVDAPLYVYNIPQTVRARVELPTLFRLIDEGVVAGMKDSQNDLEYLRQVAMFVSTGGHDFRLFAGTRYLIDAAVLIGADGAIPSIANAFPWLAVKAFEQAASGDFSGAAATCETLARLENIAAVAVGGSRNAAILALIKTVLWQCDVLASPQVTGPLRNMTSEEQARVAAQVRTILQPSP